MEEYNVSFIEKDDSCLCIETNKKYFHFLPTIIIFQAICKGWLSRKNNIYKKFKDLNTIFKKVITGYHMINKPPIKEAVWEDINNKIVQNVVDITDEANGNHKSGEDVKYDKKSISNKTTKINNNKLAISSYRLTNVCSAKSYGIEKDIKEEIKERNKNFDYYSILAREEKGDIIIYSWYIIPKDYYVFKINKLTHKIGKKSSNKGNIIGWESSNCSITFSMSSQLWFTINIDDIKKYNICSIEIDNSGDKINYSDIYDLFSNTN